MDNSEKLNIENTDTIDMLYESGGTLTLEIIDGMDWSDEARHLTLLQSKLNSYIRFIDTKQYEEKHPRAASVREKSSETSMFKERRHIIYAAVLLLL